jgi:TLC domain
MDWQSLRSEFEPLVHGPIHLPSEHIYQRVLPGVALTMMATTTIYNLAGPLSVKLLPNDQAAQRRLCYQITNISTNAFLGLLGLYYEYTLVPTTVTLSEQIQGFHEFTIFGTTQLGYQLWSLLVGTLLIEERVEMLFHHCAVLPTSFMVACLTNGFRYWTPYYFGLYELSSVPLGIMTTLKDNPSWKEAYPQTFANSRLLFAISFLTVRIVMILPRLAFLRNLFGLAYAMEDQGGYRFFYFGIWSGCMFLLFLQLYWGSLVVSGIVKQFTKKPAKSKEA